MLIRLTLLLTLLLSAGLGCSNNIGSAPDDSSGEGEGEGEGGEGEGEGEAGEGEGEGEGEVPSGPLPPGSACSCDSGCEGTSANPGLCVFGVCMQAASTECSGSGSTEECGAGSTCWNLSSGEPICWPGCDAFSCAGACADDGVCESTTASADACSSSCAEHCATDGGGGGGDDDGCPPNASPEGDSCYCDEGYVVNDDGTGCAPAENGGTGGCPPNSYLDGDSCYCNEGFVVNADASACVRECEADTDCPGSEVCGSDFSCGEPPCTAGSCGTGLTCSTSGNCVVDVGSPPPGSPQSCSDIPTWECDGNESYCGTLSTFDPRLGDGYWDYPLNGETANDQYRSYARRDVVQLVKYASASVRCIAESWTLGNGGALGLGDMSEANGDIPGTSDNSPGHPPGTHVNGHDMDIAYYQTNTVDNKLRAVCTHTSNGADQYHCTGEPTKLDVWRTAAFIAKLHDSPQLRVIGVDGRVGPMVVSAIDQLCTSGWIDGAACTGGLALAYETTDNGAGWYHFHHHHLHISLLNRNQAGLSNSIVFPPRGISTCLTPDCGQPALAVDPRRLLYRPLKARVVD